MQMTLNGSAFLLIHRSLRWHTIIAFKTSGISQTGKEDTCAMPNEKLSNSLSRIYLTFSLNIQAEEQYLLEKQKTLQTRKARHPLCIQALLLLAQHRNTMNSQTIQLLSCPERHFMESRQVLLALQLIIHLQASPEENHSISRHSHAPSASCRWPCTKRCWQLPPAVCSGWSPLHDHRAWQCMTDFGCRKSVRWHLLLTSCKGIHE